jgi:uncharacterized protein with PQ loop repeat
VIEADTPLTLFLSFNSLIIVGLILNQNETSKDSLNTKNSGIDFSTNPLEIITWICVSLEFILLLIKIKINEL